ncbi:PREDICTED: uncharacterized protein LOC104808633 isoform X2 [Tarenaya hassleriana]|uniref:uncharacterized protein LOC104808633 isoform X2 n=1 Tax=Tarenaya hassleriana TaxID=28532 RepID=UPI00053C9B4D|nr:PREDICTED: uncharacterized protein LOC104808633 isoform X2 [Tarenaya hassleriana]
MANPTVKMAFRNLRFSLKAFRFRRLLMGGGDGRKNKMNPSWLTPVSHGCYTVDRFSGSCSGNLSDSDMVLVQREQSEELEIWLFGVSDTQTRDVIAKYMQTHLFDKLRHEIAKNAAWGCEEEQRDHEKSVYERSGRPRERGENHQWRIGRIGYGGEWGRAHNGKHGRLQSGGLQRRRCSSNQEKEAEILQKALVQDDFSSLQSETNRRRRRWIRDCRFRISSRHGKNQSRHGVHHHRQLRNLGGDEEPRSSESDQTH